MKSSQDLECYRGFTNSFHVLSLYSCYDFHLCTDQQELSSVKICDRCLLFVPSTDYTTADGIYKTFPGWIQVTLTRNWRHATTSHHSTINSSTSGLMKTKSIKASSTGPGLLWLHEAKHWFGGCLLWQFRFAQTLLMGWLCISWLSAGPGATSAPAGNLEPGKILHCPLQLAMEKYSPCSHTKFSPWNWA